MGLDDFLMPGALFTKQPEKIVKEVFTPAFCKGKPITLEDLKMLWEFIQPGEKKKPPPELKEGGGRERQRRRSKLLTVTSNLGRRKTVARGAKKHEKEQKQH